MIQTMTRSGNSCKQFVIGTVIYFRNEASATKRRTAFLDMAPILFLSSAECCPAKADNAYEMLDMIKPEKNNVRNA